jgi:hypothetical protein
MPVILLFGKLRLEDLELETSLGYIVRLFQKNIYFEIRKSTVLKFWSRETRRKENVYLFPRAIC